jgi:hypothetical protein
MSYLFISFEATLADPTSAAVQQVTVSLAQAVNNQLQIVKEQSYFVNPYTFKDLFYANLETPSAQPFAYRDQLTYDTQSTKCITPEQFLPLMQKVVDMSSHVVVHTANYFIRLLEIQGVNFTGKVILDVLTHIDYAKSITNKSLPSLCAEHNFLPYATIAGEANLVRTAANNKALLTLINLYGLEHIIKNATAQKVIIQARVPFDQNSLPKQLGFHFNATHKCWELLATEEKYKEVLTMIDRQYLTFIDPAAK